jgi:two-component system sensor histidine kinase CpxA
MLLLGLNGHLLSPSKSTRFPRLHCYAAAAMKTPRFPLYAKILLWFFLNLLVLGAAAVIALSFQFPLGPELLVSGPAGQRVQALTGVIRDEINSESRTNWDATLDRFGKSYQISILLYRNDGTHVAG